MRFVSLNDFDAAGMGGRPCNRLQNSLYQAAACQRKNGDSRGEFLGDFPETGM
jgi:hypothetical protein